MTGHRYPLEPLARALGIELHVIGGHQRDDHGGLAALADRLGISHRHVQRFVDDIGRDGLSEAQADNFAVRSGRHPSEVWGSEWWVGADDDDEPMFAKGCVVSSCEGLLMVGEPVAA